MYRFGLTPKNRELIKLFIAPLRAQVLFFVISSVQIQRENEKDSSLAGEPLPDLLHWKTVRVLLLALTHAVLHHHEAALIAFEALTLKAARRVDTGAMTTQVWRDAALVNICGE